MKTNLSSSAPSQLETDCLVVVALDRSDKDLHNKAVNNKDRSAKDKAEKNKPAPSIETADAAVREAAKDVISSGEVTAKMFETTLLHHPAGLQAKRLLLIGGGRANDFSAAELRKLAGAAVLTLKGKSIRSFAFVVGGGGVVSPAEAVRAIVQGAFVGIFDPGYYKSDRTDQKIDALTFMVEGSGKGDLKSLESAMESGRIVAESQNFARDLINEPSNRMTPTILAEQIGR